MNLTIHNQKSIINPLLVNSSTALAKSSAEIGTSSYTGVLSTPIRKCFFYVRYMVDCIRHLSRWQFPVSCSSNLVQSITIQIGTCRDGLKSLLQETVMSKNKTNGPIRPKNTPNCAKSAPNPTNLEPNFANLPFYDANYKPAVFWRVDPTGDYAQECLAGEQYATAALDFMLEANFTPLLGWIVKDMAEINNFSGIEIGFMSTISEKAITQHKYDCMVAKFREVMA